MPQPQLLEVLNKAAGYLQDRGVPQARLDAEILFSRALKVKRLDLYLRFDQPVSSGELDGYREWIRRRGNREPLQHILGETEFRELTLKTDRRALISRPETEILVDVLKRHLPATDRPRVLDVGTGSGAIALSVLKELPHCQVTASDISPDCLEMTRENAARNGIPAPELFLGSLFDPFPADRRWDAIVSNPPYVANGTIESLQPEVRDFDPRIALAGGEKGWETPLDLLTNAFHRVESGGIFLMEIHPPQFELLREKALSLGWIRAEGHADYQQKNRFVLLIR